MAAEVPQPAACARVLIVEDEALIALDLERRLRRAGHRVVGIADNRDDAVALAGSEAPDLVLMDICIRGPADGIDAARDIGRLSDVPVVFLTAFADDSTTARAAGASPYGYILKPFDERTLNATLRVAIERHAADTRQRLLAAAVDSANVGIVMADVRGAVPAIDFCNDAFERICGLPRERIVGSHPWFLLDDAPDADRDILRAAMRERRAAEHAVTLRDAAGRTRWLSVTVSPVRSTGGVVTHILVFHLDITRLRATEMALSESQRAHLAAAEALREANNALTRRNQDLQRFVMVASHDLQEPLRKVQTFGDRLLGEDGPVLDPRHVDYLDRMLRSASRMRSLIEDLLGYSRITTGRGARQAIDLGAAVADLMVDLEVEAAESGASVRVGDSPPLRADPVQFRQLLQNLIGNALKYRDPARPLVVEIGGRVETDARGTPLYRLRVADNGIGFEPEHARRIFKPFQRLHGREQYAGNGIGLAIVSSIAEQHGGDVVAHGEPGRGAEFVVTLRLDD